MCEKTLLARNPAACAAGIFVFGGNRRNFKWRREPVTPKNLRRCGGILDCGGKRSDTALGEGILNIHAPPKFESAAAAVHPPQYCYGGRAPQSPLRFAPAGCRRNPKAAANSNGSRRVSNGPLLLRCCRRSQTTGAGFFDFRGFLAGFGAAAGFAGSLSQPGGRQR
jgi:hypothetical protein